jgi:hypothetical protein
MEVRGRQPGGADEAQHRFKRIQAELSSANRAKVRRARQVLQTLSAERMARQRSANRKAADSIRAKGEDAIRGQAKGSVDPATIERLSDSARADAAALEKRSESTRAETRASMAKQDRVELSRAARELSAEAERAGEARLQELREAHQAGSLNTEERISDAARRLLGG